MRMLVSSCLLLTLVFLLANFSSQQEESADRHSINFYGTLTTLQDKQYSVENISISGLHSNIAVFAKPADKNTNPTIDTTRLNLEDVRAITRTPEQLQVLTFKNREYIEITVAWRDPQKKNDIYIIERNKQIICNETKSPKPKKEVALEAISKLEIKGYKYKSQETKCPEKKQE